MTDKALRYDDNKPELVHIAPLVWQSWINHKLSPDGKYSVLIDINERVDNFFYCKDSCLLDAWKDVASDEMLMMVQVLEFGAQKYEPMNWAKGMKWSRIMNCFRRHIFAICCGQIFDEESNASHMGHVLCNLMFLTFYAENNIGEDDRP